MPRHSVGGIVLLLVVGMLVLCWIVPNTTSQHTIHDEESGSVFMIVDNQQQQQQQQQQQHEAATLLDRQPHYQSLLDRSSESIASAAASMLPSAQPEYEKLKNLREEVMGVMERLQSVTEEYQVVLERSTKQADAITQHAIDPNLRALASDVCNGIVVCGDDPNQA
jgi:hypothetical protein